MKTEKISINLNPAELGQIDLLVERGVFDNRSDFMRAAARKSLEAHEDTFKQFLQVSHYQESSEITLVRTVGIYRLSKREAERLVAVGGKVDIRVIGLCLIADDITPEEIRKIVIACKVSGKLSASDDVKAILLDLAD